jgi:ferredoxin-type protein NapH
MVSMPVKIKPTFSLWLRKWRILIQALFAFVFINPWLRIHSVCSPVFHCYACPLASFACPIGVIGQFAGIHAFPYLAVGTVLLAGTILGSYICGYVCPFGFLQDLIGKIPTKKFHLSRQVGYLRYAVLIGLVIIIPFLFTEKHPLFFCRVCPAGALEGAVPVMIQQATAGQGFNLPNTVKTTILVLFLLAMFVKMRPWCRLLCPLGAIFGIFNRASAVYMRLDKSKCFDCRQCQKKCRYGIIPGEELQSTNCIRCMECTSTACGGISITTIFNRQKPEGEKSEPCPVCSLETKKQ